MRTQSKFLLLNGTKGCGKDTLADYLIARSRGHTTKLETKEPLYELVPILFNINKEVFMNAYLNRELKELPLEGLYLNTDKFNMLGIVCDPDLKAYKEIGGGYCISPRLAMIYVSEVVVKPSMGYDWFGITRAVRAKAMLNTNQLIIDPSCGFEEEVHPLIKAVGQENIMLLRIHSDREGCTTKGDSRKYIPDEVIDKTEDIDNNGDISSYLKEATKLINDWWRS